MTVAQLEEFSKNFVINEDGCWVWQKRPNNSGYGSAYDGHSRVVAHRAMYTAFYGPIPEKHDIDHLCRNRMCVNPRHLEAVTRRENLMRGVGPEMLRKRHQAITHCPRGHAYTPDNTYVWGKTRSRYCKICYHEHNVKRYQAKKTHTWLEER